MYLQNSGLDRCVVLHTSSHYWSLLIPSCSYDDKEYKHTIIRVKSAPYAPLPCTEPPSSFRNYNICTKQKYGTALVLILETVSQEIL